MPSKQRLQSITPSDMAPPFALYAHGVVDSLTGMIMTSGQLALAQDGTIPDGVEGQADLIFSNIYKILTAAGGSRECVMRINAYVTERAHMPGYMIARDRWLKGIPHLPASTLMIVGGFTRPEFMVEIEVSAVLQRGL